MKKLKFRKIPIYVFERANEITKKMRKNKFIYAVRHAENDWSKPVTIEKHVCCNLWGVILADDPLSKFFIEGDFIPLTKKESEDIGR